MSNRHSHFPGRPAWRRMVDIVHDDHGAVAVSFILCLPIFLTLIGIIVQLALLVNAKIMVDNALHTAARSAVTALPEHQFDAIQRAARFALVPVSPQAQTAPSQEATAVSAALSDCGVAVPATFAARYTYATEAANVTWNPSGTDYQRSAGQEVQVTLHYKFYLTVPLVMNFIAPNTQTVAGVSGRYVDIGSVCTIQTAHGRQAVTDGDGWPQGVPQ